jgi:hypothetical protein
MGGKPDAIAPRVTHGNTAFLPLKMRDPYAYLESLDRNPSG